MVFDCSLIPDFICGFVVDFAEVWFSRIVWIVHVIIVLGSKLILFLVFFPTCKATSSGNKGQFNSKLFEQLTPIQ